MTVWFDNKPQTESFVDTKAVAEWSPTLGSLRAFLSVAEHRNWEAVAKELKIDATTAAKQVAKLEGWLHQPLFWQSVPIEMNAAVADTFIPAAINVLQSMQKYCLDYTSKNSKFWKLSFSDLSLFLEFSRSINNNRMRASYKNSTLIEEGRSEISIRRLVKKIELAFGVYKVNSFISGRSLQKLTDDGERFSQELDRSLALLNSFRADISRDVLGPHSKARDF